MTTTFDEEPMLYKAYNTYFVTMDNLKLELKARIFNLPKWNPVIPHDEFKMIMINTQDGGLLTQLDSLLSARYITGTTCSVEIEEDDGVKYTLNGCTVEMLAVLMETLAHKNKEDVVKDDEHKDEEDDEHKDEEYDEHKDEEYDEHKDEEYDEHKDEDPVDTYDDDLEYNFYEEMAELTTKALNLASHIIASLKLKFKAH
jgi:hypothetical protein